jgi:glucosylceramidase
MIRVTGLFLLAVLITGCNKKSSVPPDNTNHNDTVITDVKSWITNPTGSAFLQGSNIAILFKTGTPTGPSINVDSTVTYQSIDGFGNCLTGGSAKLINAMSQAKRSALLTELFATDNFNIGISYLRISIGASDLSDHEFSYDDIPFGQTDNDMANFSLETEKTDLIPVLKEILAINKDIKILGSPWSAPVWMKTNGSFKGGSLKPECFNAYAKYFVKYIQGMKSEGINIDAVTIQNEPLNPYNNPSMYMSAKDQAEFIKTWLGPAFEAANISTKIIVYDHNADRPDYADSVLTDTDAAQYVDGSAFHLYSGNISALTPIHNKYPSKNLYFTEQWVGGPGDFTGDISWHVENLIIGGTRNWSRNVLEWNMASDPSYDPHTDGGCTTCLGTVTINGDNVTRNPAYYILAHSAKFVRPGSVRIMSDMPDNLPNVAFVTPEGKKVLIVLNKASEQKQFNVVFRGRYVTLTLPQKSVGTYVW